MRKCAKLKLELQRRTMEVVNGQLVVGVSCVNRCGCNAIRPNQTKSEQIRPEKYYFFLIGVDGEWGRFLRQSGAFWRIRG